MEITMETRKVNTKNLLKFILCSGFGVLMFLVPIPQGDSFTTLLDFLKSGLKGLFGASLRAYRSGHSGIVGSGKYRGHDCQAGHYTEQSLSEEGIFNHALLPGL